MRWAAPWTGFGVTRFFDRGRVGDCGWALRLATLGTSIAMLSTWRSFLVGFASAVGFGPLIADISHWFVRRRGIAVALVASGNYLSGAFWPLVLAGMLARQRMAERLSVSGCGYGGRGDPAGALALRRQVPDDVHASARGTALIAERAIVRPVTPRALQYLLGLGRHRVLRGHVDAASPYRVLLR